MVWIPNPESFVARNGYEEWHLLLLLSFLCIACLFYLRHDRHALDSILKSSKSHDRFLGVDVPDEEFSVFASSCEPRVVDPSDCDDSLRF